MSDKCPECGVEGNPLYLSTDQCGHTEHRTGFDIEAGAEFCYDSPMGLLRCSSYNGCDDWNPSAEAEVHFEADDGTCGVCGDPHPCWEWGNRGE